MFACNKLFVDVLLSLTSAIRDSMVNCTSDYNYQARRGLSEAPYDTRVMKELRVF